MRKDWVILFVSICLIVVFGIVLLASKDYNDQTEKTFAKIGQWNLMTMKDWTLLILFAVSLGVILVALSCSNFENYRIREDTPIRDYLNEMARQQHLQGWDQTKQEAHERATRKRHHGDAPKPL